MSRTYGGLNADGQPVDTDWKLIETCIESVRDSVFYGYNPCGRKLKGDPEYPHLCGLHISFIRRERAKMSAREEAREVATAETQEAYGRARAIEDVLGVKLRVETSLPNSGPERFISRPTGRVSLTLDELEALVTRVKGLGW